MYQKPNTETRYLVQICGTFVTGLRRQAISHCTGFNGHKKTKVLRIDTSATV